MDSIQFETLKKNIIEYLKASLKESRYEHTMNVARLAKKMANDYDEDVQKAEIAALLHDMARNIPIETINMYIEHLGLPERYKGNVNLAHSKIGSQLAKMEFHIEDSDILNAISFHTTGRKDMSLLEKIIFIADAIEPNRKYSGVEDIRQQAKVNIDKACLMSLTGTVNYIKSKDIVLDRDTLDAKEYFEKCLSMTKKQEGN